MQAVPGNPILAGVMKEVDGNNQRFPRSARLLSSAEFQHVFRKPKKFHSRFFSLFVACGSQSHSRLGLAVSKKSLPKAVSRNRVKRVVRESFRKNQWQFCSLDVIFVARHDLRLSDNEQLSNELTRLWKKLADYCDSYSPE